MEACLEKEMQRYWNGEKKEIRATVDLPEISRNTENDNQHGVIDIKPISNEGQHSHGPHDLEEGKTGLTFPAFGLFSHVSQRFWFLP